MKLFRSLLAVSAFALSLGAQAAATGSLGGGSGTFLTLSGPGTIGSGGMLSGVDTGTISGGTVLTSGGPFAAAPAGAMGPFLAAGPAPNNQEPATLTFMTGVKEISFLWGSPDLFNILTVESSDGSMPTFTAAGMGFSVTNGNQSFAQYVTFVASAGTTITNLIFSNSTTQDGFEVANFNVAAVPEPEIYALILAGLGAIGFITRRRRNSQP
jgi:PEP-CTERM motif